MLMHFLGDVDASRQRRLLNYVLSQQNEDGGWPIFHGGPSDPNATVKAYFALRLAGFSDAIETARRARARILEFGGLEVCNSYTKFYLAIFGQYDWERLPAMIPEIMLLPRSSRIPNLYRISAWTRTIVVPMLIIYALRPRVEIPFSVRDLILPHRPLKGRSPAKTFLHAAFRALDLAMRFYNRAPVRPVRRRALEAARLWMLERIRPAGGLGAIYPPMLNAVIALRTLGYRDDSPELSKARREFNNLNLLRACGLDAPAGIAFGEERRAGFVVRAFLISEGVANPQPLDLLIRDWLPIQPTSEQRHWRAELIRRLADYTRRLHAQRFVHHDYFWRNIILTGTSLEHFALIDAHKGRVWPAWAEQRSRAKDLATLDAPAPAFFRRTERMRFLLAYLGKKKLAAADKEFLRRVSAIAEPLRDRQLRRVREAGTRV